MRRMSRSVRALLAICILGAFLMGGWQFAELRQKHRILSQDYEELGRQYGYSEKNLRDSIEREKIAERINKDSEIKHARIEKELMDRIGVLTEELTRKEESAQKLQADYNFLAAQNDALQSDISRLQSDVDSSLFHNKNLEIMMHSAASIAEEREREIGALKREIILLSQTREVLQEVLKGRLPPLFRVIQLRDLEMRYLEILVLLPPRKPLSARIQKFF